ncbi:sugar transferase [bacterium]|nr:sugar transferase [bacterium]
MTPSILLKRLYDCLLILLFLPIILPVCAVTAILVRSRLGSPVLFRQMRPGMDGRLFEMYKFRSMLDCTDSKGEVLADEKRLTSFGARLRASSLDELPALWNVLLGQMSLVGPRPLLPEYLPLYNADQRRRHEVLPGITGWAQVNGRNTLSWDEKFALDIWYVENRSLWLDTRVLLRTIGRVVQRDGISASNNATMTKFTGTSTSNE